MFQIVKQLLANVKNGPLKSISARFIQNPPETKTATEIKESRYSARQKTHQSQRIEDNRKQLLKGLANLSILIVEDNVSFRRELENQLQQLGYSIKVADDGAEAIALIETDKPDLLLIDLSLPSMDGRQTAKILRRHHDNSIADLPIICLSSKMVDNTNEHNSNNLFDALLQKPTDKDSLERTITNVMLSSAFVPNDDLS